MNKDATEHGHLNVTNLSMVSDSCKSKRRQSQKPLRAKARSLSQYSTRRMGFYAGQCCSLLWLQDECSGGLLADVPAGSRGFWKSWQVKNKIIL